MAATSMKLRPVPAPGGLHSLELRADGVLSLGPPASRRHTQEALRYTEIRERPRRSPELLGGMPEQRGRLLEPLGCLPEPLGCLPE
jgi:hypothetical protein